MQLTALRPPPPPPAAGIVLGGSEGAERPERHHNVAICRGFQRREEDLGAEMVQLRFERD